MLVTVLELSAYVMEMVFIFIISEKTNFISYLTNKGIFYTTFSGKIMSAKFPLTTENDKPIISYDIDVLGRTVYYTTEEGLYRHRWGLDPFYSDPKLKINDLFSIKTKVRFDNVGKLIFISDISGIYISSFPYREYTLITEKTSISNFEIISEIGYNFL